MCSCKTGGPVCDKCAAEQIEAFASEGEEMQALPPGTAADLIAQVDNWFGSLQVQSQGEMAQ